MTIFAISLALLFSEPQVSNDIVVDRPLVWPSAAWRAFGGICGQDQYELSFWPDQNLAKSVRNVRVNDQNYTGQVVAALKAWKNVDGHPIDLVIEHCEKDRVYAKFYVVMRSDLSNVHSFYFRLDRKGNVDLEGER